MLQDKKNLMNVIEDLDKKKESCVWETFIQVNNNFSNIFSTLLPGAKCELYVVNDKKFLEEGIEIRVGFGGEWKEGLSELSGG